MIYFPTDNGSIRTVNAYCGYFSLRTGCTLIGILQVILALSLAFAFVALELMPKGDFVDWTVEDFVILLTTVYSACNSTYLLKGALKDNKKFVSFYLFTQIIWLIVAVAVALWYLINNHDDKKLGLGVVSLMVAVAFYSYNVVVVYSRYKQMEPLDLSQASSWDCFDLCVDLFCACCFGRIK